MRTEELADFSLFIVKIEQVLYNNIVLHTYSQWKKLGYQVKKGEKSEHKISVWKRSTKKVENENEDGEKEEVDNGRYFLKLSAFFTQEQVERIEK